MTSMPTGVICGPFLSVPVKGQECREAVWSEGRACRRCDDPTCYRRGMLAAEARADNAWLQMTKTYARPAPKEKR